MPVTPVRVLFPDSVSVPVPDLVRAIDEAPPLETVPLMIVAPAPLTVSATVPALPPVPPLTAPAKSSALVVLSLVNVHEPAAPVPSSTLALKVSLAATLALIVTAPKLSSESVWLPTPPEPIV